VSLTSDVGLGAAVRDHLGGPLTIEDEAIVLRPYQAAWLTAS
jgi:hypothetical protein